MSEHRKCLRTLGLQDGASESEIRSAYRKLALQYHPDKNESDDAKERFQEIGYAYKYLSDGPGHVTGCTFEREDDVVINMFREMFFAQFMQQRFAGFGFPFMFDDDCDDDEDYYYYSDDSEDEEFTHGPFCGRGPRSTEPPPPNIYQEESKKQKQKREKRQRQKERAKEKKEQERKSGADSSSASKPTENAECKGPGEVPYSAPTSQEKSVPPTQKLTKKQKKQLEAQQHKRDEEMKRIAEELLCKQEQDRERQREKEREKKAREQQEKRDQLKGQEKGLENSEIPAFYDHGKKSRKARQRERRRQEAQASVNLPSSTTAADTRPPGSTSRSSSCTTSADISGPGLSAQSAPDQSESSASSRSSTPLSVPSTVSSTSGSDQKPRKSLSKPQPASTQKKSQQAVGGAKQTANRFQVLDNIDDIFDDSDPGSSHIKNVPRNGNITNGFCEAGHQDTTTQQKLGNSSTSGSPRHDHKHSTFLIDQNSGSNSKSSNAKPCSFYSTSKGPDSREPAKNSQPPLNGSQASYPGSSGGKNDNPTRFYNDNHTSYNGYHGNITGPNKGRGGPMNGYPGPFMGQSGPYAASHGPYTNSHVPYNGGPGPYAGNYGPYGASHPYNGGRVYYNTNIEYGQSQNYHDNRYNNGTHYSQSSKQTGPMQATPHNTGPGQATPNNTGPTQATPHNTGPRQSTPHNTGPRQATPHNTGPRQASPHNTGPRQSTPHNTGPMQATTHNTGPRQATPHNAGPRQATPHHAGGSGQQRPREGQKGLPQFTFGKGGFPIPKGSSAFDTKSTMDSFRQAPSGQQNNLKNKQQTSFKHANGQRTVPTNASIPQTSPLNPQFSQGDAKIQFSNQPLSQSNVKPQFSNQPSSQGDAKPTQYSREATLFSFEEPKVAAPDWSYGTNAFVGSGCDHVENCDSLDSLDDFSLYDCKGSAPGASNRGNLGLGNSVLNSGLGVPAGMFTDSIKNYYK